MDKELANFFRKHDMRAMAVGGPSINEEEVTFADDGHREILETIKTPIKGDGGRLIGVLGIARDITERKAAEEKRKQLEEQLRQSHKMEAVGTIAGGIAHDFNNILGIIIGNAELAIEGIDARDPAHPHLKEIRQAGLRASGVIKQLLHFSRKTEQQKAVIDVAPLAEEAVKLMRASLPSSIDIQLDIPPRTGNIKADPTQLHQVLINLCTNAAHAMEEKGGILRIELSEIDLDDTTAGQFHDITQGVYVRIAVSDTGHGIDEATRPKIFDPYFTTKDVGKGTGMGLSVVHGIVKNLDGDISVSSEPGKGSVFTVLLPVSAEQGPGRKKGEGAPPGGTETILYIDDEEALVNLGVSMLAQLGYKVVGQTDPAAALALFRSDPAYFDLIITDMTMPRMSGDQLVREVRGITPHTPVILCTGFSAKMNHEKAIQIGASCYIEKPFNKQRLAKIIRQALDRQVSKESQTNSDSH